MIPPSTFMTMTAGLSAMAILLGGSISTDTHVTNDIKPLDPMRYVLDEKALAELKSSARYQDRITGRIYYMESKTGDMFWANGEPKRIRPQRL